MARRFRYAPRKKVCSYCKGKIDFIDYKDVDTLKKHLNDKGKILSRRTTGCCAKHQRKITAAIKRARNMALLPYTTG
jgi:small subunit ribosomal protein S18